MPEPLLLFAEVAFRLWWIPACFAVAAAVERATR